MHRATWTRRHGSDHPGAADRRVLFALISYQGAPMIDTAQPQVKSIENSATYGKFEIEPLEPGFGTTLGNALRRVLLSTLKGAAVTSVSIEGVAHEFSSIPYVKEDVTEIILNLKGLNLISYSDDPVRLTLDVTGPRGVKAAHIPAPSDVEIVNPELYICTLDSNKGRLRMELTVERGKGYVPAERNKKKGKTTRVSATTPPTAHRRHPDRRHLQPGGQGELLDREDPRRPGNRLGQADPRGLDRRNDPARPGDQRGRQAVHVAPAPVHALHGPDQGRQRPPGKRQ